MIQLKSDFDLLAILKNPLDEAAVAKINANSLRFFLAVIYNKPIMPKVDFLKAFDIFLESWRGNSKPSIICGHFNIEIFELSYYIND